MARKVDPCTGKTTESQTTLPISLAEQTLFEAPGKTAIDVYVDDNDVGAIAGAIVRLYAYNDGVSIPVRAVTLEVGQRGRVIRARGGADKWLVTVQGVLAQSATDTGRAQWSFCAYGDEPAPEEASDDARAARAARFLPYRLVTDGEALSAAAIYVRRLSIVMAAAPAAGRWIQLHDAPTTGGLVNGTQCLAEAWVTLKGEVKEFDFRDPNPHAALNDGYYFATGLVAYLSTSQGTLTKSAASEVFGALLEYR